VIQAKLSQEEALRRARQIKLQLVMLIGLGIGLVIGLVFRLLALSGS
jgi:hypothetical protein